MIRGLIAATLLFTAGALAPVHAAIGSAQDEAPRREAGALHLAQSGDVQVFYDEYGRRVLLDAFTGEIIAIEEPRRRELAPWEDDRSIRRDDRRSGRSYPQERDYARGQRYPYEPDLRGYGERGGYDEYGEPYPLTPEQEQVYVDPVERRPLGESYPPQDGVTGSTVPAPTELAPSRDFGEPTAPSIGAKSDENVAKLQVLLDRGGASPGVIDGRDGSNVRKALLAYEELTGQTLPIGNGAALDAALAASGGSAFVDYTITPEDVAVPMVASVPADYGEKAKLEHLSFTSVTEMLAERFHMDEKYLVSLNPDVNFNRAGTIIRVASVGGNVKTQVERIVADKGRKQVRAYDAQGNLVAAYPSTIGSSATPSPTGTHQVARIAVDPEYTYNPKINFKQGENDKVLRIPPGPNGPVGTIWIALDKPTYGIHGTPDPSKIGKTESNGCVRLTNWDAAELAKLVKPGVFVQFIE